MQAERPIAVFCGNLNKNYAQMPPRETLGVKHYIPALDLNNLQATVQMKLVATEDSTAVIIKGDYHQLDTVSLTGQVYSRNVENGTVKNCSFRNINYF